MDTVANRLKGILSQYKYILIVIAAGLALMLLPSGKKEASLPSAPEVSTSASMQESLEEILGRIHGVGKVKILLTQAQGERTVYVYDQSSSGESVRSDAVIITDSERTQGGMISQVIPPVYLGAIIVCEGGDSPTVRLAVVEAVCDATGLTADKISVWKMK